MKKLLLIAVIASLFFSACKSGKENLSGAGATFPLPYYNMTFKNFQAETGINVSYGGIGSGGGIRSLKDEIVDFAGTDAFLSEKEMSEMNPVIHIPTCLGAIVLSYNLPSVKELNLTGEIISDIYLGKITKWNDTKIQAVNPNVTLPDKNITPVYRSDGSGTTFVFTDYMSKVSNEWKDRLGNGKSVNFATGVAAKGNPGVAGTISNTVGAIGYIGSEYAFALNVPIANLQNAAGQFVTPTTSSISSAATGFIPDDMRCMITNSPNQNAYPISCFTWIIVYKEQNYAGRNILRANTTVDLLNYMLSDAAQDLTEKIHYAPIPSQVREMAHNAISTMTFDGSPIKNL